MSPDKDRIKGLDDNVQDKKGWPHTGLSFPWVIILLSFLLLLIANINSNTFGVFFKPIAEEFGWSRGAVSGTLALRALIAGIFALPMGYLADRYGPRRVLLPTFLLLGLSFLLFSKIASLWQFYLIQSLFIGIAMSVPFVCVMSTVGKWHNTRPGLALGLTSAGTGLSSVIFPPLSTALIASGGWRQAIFILGLITLIIAVPISLFMKDPPSAKRKNSGKPAGIRNPFIIWLKLPGLLKNRVFLALILVFFFFPLAGNLLIVHFVNIATDTGVNATIAASMMSVMGIVSTVGRVSMGAISDRIGTKADTALCCVSLILSLIFLMLPVPGLMWVSAALLGLGFGGMAPLVPAVMGTYFGWINLATMTGAITIGSNLGAMVGPWMAGFTFDISHSYLPALAISTAFTVAALVIILRLPSAPDFSENKLPEVGITTNQP
jgi:MFS family permease